MKNRKKALEIVEKAVKDSFEREKLSTPKVKKYLNLFIKLPKSEAIVYLTEYKRAIQREENKTTLFIESSVALSQQQKNKIVSMFKKDQPISNVETKLNPSILGGVLIKIGDMIYEDTITSRINQLGETIANG